MTVDSQLMNIAELSVFHTYLMTLGKRALAGAPF